MGSLGLYPRGGLLMDNDAKNSHNGRMAIVKLDGMIGELGIGSKIILILVPKH